MKSKKSLLMLLGCALMTTFLTTSCTITITRISTNQSTEQKPIVDGGGGGESGGNKTDTDYSTDYLHDFDGYYASISPTATGNELLNQLRELNKSKRKKLAGYDHLKNNAKYMDTCSSIKGKILSFYSREVISKSWDGGTTWNREHVWPKSRGGGNVENDIHMPRPILSSDNSDRGNKLYAEKGAYDPGCLGYPNYRGICARIIFYCVVADSSLSILDNTSGGSHSMGKLSDLLKWNKTYLPSTSANADIELQVEQNRNNYIAQTNIQGNRNPFIDHPEFAERIWGK